MHALLNRKSWVRPGIRVGPTTVSADADGCAYLHVHGSTYGSTYGSTALTAWELLVAATFFERTAAESGLLALLREFFASSPPRASPDDASSTRVEATQHG